MHCWQDLGGKGLNEIEPVEAFGFTQIYRLDRWRKIAQTNLFKWILEKRPYVLLLELDAQIYLSKMYLNIFKFG